MFLFSAISESCVVLYQHNKFLFSSCSQLAGFNVYVGLYCSSVFLEAVGRSQQYFDIIISLYVIPKVIP